MASVGEQVEELCREAAETAGMNQKWAGSNHSSPVGNGKKTESNGSSPVGNVLPKKSGSNESSPAGSLSRIGLPSNQVLVTHHVTLMIHV